MTNSGQNRAVEIARQDGGGTGADHYTPKRDEGNSGIRRSDVSRLSGSDRASLVLTALKSGVDAASRELATKLEKSGVTLHRDAAYRNTEIHMLLAEFTKSISSPKTPEPPQKDNSPRPPALSPVGASGLHDADAPNVTAKKLQAEHACVSATVLGGYETRFIAEVLQMMPTRYAQRTVLVFAGIEAGRQIIPERSHNLIRDT